MEISDENKTLEKILFQAKQNRIEIKKNNPNINQLSVKAVNKNDRFLRRKQQMQKRIKFPKESPQIETPTTTVEPSTPNALTDPGFNTNNITTDDYGNIIIKSSINKDDQPKMNNFIAKSTTNKINNNFFFYDNKENPDSNKENVEVNEIPQMEDVEVNISNLDMEENLEDICFTNPTTNYAFNDFTGINRVNPIINQGIINTDPKDWKTIDEASKKEKKRNRPNILPRNPNENQVNLNIKKYNNFIPYNKKNENILSQNKGGNNPVCINYQSNVENMNNKDTKQAKEIPKYIPRSFIPFNNNLKAKLSLEKNKNATDSYLAALFPELDKGTIDKTNSYKVDDVIKEEKEEKEEIPQPPNKINKRPAYYVPKVNSKNSKNTYISTSQGKNMRQNSSKKTNEIKIKVKELKDLKENIQNKAIKTFSPSAWKKNFNFTIYKRMTDKKKNHLGNNHNKSMILSSINKNNNLFMSYENKEFTKTMRNRSLIPYNVYIKSSNPVSKSQSKPKRENRKFPASKMIRPYSHKGDSKDRNLRLKEKTPTVSVLNSRIHEGKSGMFQYPKTIHLRSKTYNNPKTLMEIFTNDNNIYHNKETDKEKQIQKEKLTQRMKLKKNIFSIQLFGLNRKNNLVYPNYNYISTETSTNFNFNKHIDASISNRRIILAALLRLKFEPLSMYSNALNRLNKSKRNLFCILVNKDIFTKQFSFRALYEINTSDNSGTKIFSTTFSPNKVSAKEFSQFFCFNINKNTFFSIRNEKKKFDVNTILMI